MKFLECVKEFLAIQIDLEEDIVELVNVGWFQNTIVDQKLIELKTNHIPKGMVPLEILFDHNDAYLNLAYHSFDDNTINCNIGT